MNTNNFKRNKPKSTSRGAARGAPASAPRLVAPRGMKNDFRVPGSNPRFAQGGSSSRFSQGGGPRNSPGSGHRNAPRIVPEFSKYDRPRLNTKVSTRIAPENAPKIAPLRVSKPSSSAGMLNSVSKQTTSWGNEAEWYDDYLADSDSYQRQIIMPNIVRIIEPKAGKKILDLACGQGLFSEPMINMGASVIGVDISEELIDIAKNKLKGKMSKEDSFIVSPADKLISAGIEESSCDSAMCILASQNIKEFDVAIKETAKVLKPKGKFVIVLNHPCFRVPKQSDWHFDAEGGGPEGDQSYTIVNGKKIGRYGRVVYSYMSEGVIKIDMHPGEQDRRKKSYTTSFHRPMQVYSKWLSNAGFCILRIEEWTSHKKSNPGTRELADKRSKKEIPLFMCIEAVLL